MSVARQGFRYIGFSLFIGVVISVVGKSILFAAPFICLSAFIAFFFRDPERFPPTDSRHLVSPGDGKVVFAGAVQDNPSLVQVSIFLSIFDVHINRSPLTAIVEKIQYMPGSYFPAYKDIAGSRNERNEVTLVDGDFKVIVRQIAGVVARRIICTVSENGRVQRGERFGLIQFGSRMEVLLPSSVKLCVQIGDRVRGGESVIAERL